MNPKHFTLIPIRYSVAATSVLLFTGLSVVSFHAAAQSAYPDTYSDTTTTEAAAPQQPEPPKIEFEPTPEPCKPGDDICINAYLETFQQNLQGSILSSVPPSPVYTRRIEDGQHCALGNTEKCNNQEEEWRKKWVESASKRQLDLEAPANKDLTCKKAYDYWGLKYYYMCQKQ